MGMVDPVVAPRWTSSYALRMLAIIVVVTIAACSAPKADSSGAASSPQTVDSGEKTYPTTAQVLMAVKSAQTLSELPHSVEASLTQENDTALKNPFDCVSVDNQAHAEYFGDCAFGDPGGSKLMAVYGDSHASMWAFALASVAKANGWKLRVFSLGGCPVPNLHFISSQTLAPNTNCDLFHATAAESIRELRPDLVILTSFSSEYLAEGRMPGAAEWQQGLESAFHDVSQPGTRLAMLGDIPTWPQNDARCLAAHVDAVQECSVAAADGTPVNLDAEKAAAATVGATYVSTIPWACLERCEPVIAETRVFSNQYHFSRLYTEYVTGALGESLQPALH